MPPLFLSLAKCLLFSFWKSVLPQVNESYALHPVPLLENSQLPMVCTTSKLPKKWVWKSVVNLQVEQINSWIVFMRTCVCVCMRTCVCVRVCVCERERWTILFPIFNFVNWYCIFFKKCQSLNTSNYLCIIDSNYIKWGMQAKGIWKQDPEANIWTQEGWEWEVEKGPQWGTS